MARPLRVGIFVSPYGRYYGSQQAARQLGADLPASGVEPVFVLPGEGPATEQLRSTGAEVLVHRAPPELDVFGGALLRASPSERARLAVTRLAPYTRSLRELMRQRRIELLHANESRALLLAGPAARLLGIPTLWHVRGELEVLGGVYRGVSAALATSIVLVAEGLRVQVPSWALSKTVTVRDGIHTPPVAVRSREQLLGRVSSPDAMLVVVASSLTPFKGAHHVIEALRLLETRAASSPPVRVVFLGTRGDEAYARHLDERVAAAGLGSRVHFVGWDPRPSDWLRAADVVCLPTVQREALSLDGVSRALICSEGLSRTVLEAMAVGRPVVASAVAAVPEQVIHERTGLLVPPSDPAALGEALSRLARSSELRAELGAGGARLFAQRFTAERMTRELVDLYHALCDRPRHARRGASRAPSPDRAVRVADAR